MQQNDWEDVAILTGLSCSTGLLFSLIWLFLGPMGVSGTVAGYIVGLWVYIAPWLED